ncbi:hypothetical protein LCGC14_2194510 [marine sediment metagenome]|uniref:Uncharacterized protein n=1 Tax=marine sediment metagenome TaxID=412755 RepID=A0A0F9DIP2_9ZZZZ
MADEKKLSVDEMLKILDKHAAEDDAAKAAAAAAAPQKKKVAKVKDLLKEGAKQGRGGLGLGTRKQLDALEKEGY